MTLPSNVRMWWWRHGRIVRYVAAAVLVVLGVASLAAARQPAGPGRPVTVAARDLAAGHRLVAGDLTTATSSLPLDTIDAPTAVGELLRGPVAAGEPLTRTRIAPGRTVAPRPGSVVFPLPVSDARVAALLQPGDRVDVLVSPDALHNAEPRVAAANVEVVTVAEPTGSGVVSVNSGAMVLLQVPDAQARSLAAIRRGDQISLSIR